MQYRIQETNPIPIEMDTGHSPEQSWIITDAPEILAEFLAIPDPCS